MMARITRMGPNWFHIQCLLGVFALTALLTTPQARADTLPLGAAANYGILYEGTNGHNLQITNVTLDGNIGVGGTGKVHDSGPSFVYGRLDFSAPNTGQFSGAPGDIGPTSLNYNVASVTNALNTVNSLNSSLAVLGKNLSINGNQTISESAG